MVRKPDPRGQARILADSLQAAGIQVTLSAALDLVARQHGHKDWNVMAKSLAKKTPPQARRAALATKSPDMYETTVGGWSVNDMLTQRPDLLPREALDALHWVAKHADASIGVNWETLESNADHYYPLRRTLVMDLRVPSEADIRVELNIKTGQLHRADPQACPGTVTLRSTDELERLHIVEVVDDAAELVLREVACSYRETEDDDYSRHRLLVTCISPSELHGKAEERAMPFGMLLKNARGVMSLEAEGLFKELQTQPAHALVDASLEDAMACGAATALSAFTLALAGKGVEVWDHVIREALEESVLLVANELT